MILPDKGEEKREPLCSHICRYEIDRSAAVEKWEMESVVVAFPRTLLEGPFTAPAESAIVMMGIFFGYVVEKLGWRGLSVAQRWRRKGGRRKLWVLES